MNDVLGFVSFAGELEKSNLLLNLAACFARKGKRTLLVDLSCPAPSLDVLGECAEAVVYTAADVAAGRATLSRAILPLSVKKGRTVVDDLLFLLPSSAGECLRADGCTEVLRAVRAQADFDVALVWFSYHNVTREGLDGLFLLTDGDEVSLRAAEANGDKPGADAFLLTAFPTDWDTAQRMLPVLSVVDRVGLSLLGVVPPLPNGLSGIVGGGCTRARAYTRALENITDRFLGKNTPLLSGVPLAGIGRRRLLTRGE